MEETLPGDFSIVKAQKADKKGNLYYHKTARNFNEDVILGGKIRIAEVEEIVENGELDPDWIHTPGIFVDRVFVGEKFEKRIEKHVYDKSDLPPTPSDKLSHKERVRNKIVERAAKEVSDGQNINLGIGMPTLLPSFAKGVQIMLQSEIGVLGVGLYPKPGKEHQDYINAGKVHIATNISHK